MGKGGSFEREISTALSLWYSQGEKDDIFWRADSSGGRFTQRAKKGKTTGLQTGDIKIESEEGILLLKWWSIECKTGYGGKKKLYSKEKEKKKRVVLGEFQKQWGILDLIDSQQQKNILFKFWEQCHRDAKIAGKEPVLFFRRNLRKVCVAFRKSYFSQMKGFFGDPDFTYIFINSSEKEKLIIINMKDFFAWANGFESFLLQSSKFIRRRI